MALIAAGLAATQAGAVAGDASKRPVPTLAVLPFEIDDNSGEAGGPDRHEAMLANLRRFVGERIAAAKLYRVVPQARVDDAVAAASPGTYLRSCNGCERDIARSVGADRVMIAWMFKMSSLVLTLHIVIKDVASGDVVYAHVFDFRGDNESAWRHAADYMVKSLSKRIKQASTN